MAQAALVVPLAAAPALADPTKDQCIDANGNAQSLRREGQLAAARAQLRVCADPSCAAMVRDDCAKRLDELERAQPTIIFDAKDGAGHDLSARRRLERIAMGAAPSDSAAQSSEGMTPSTSPSTADRPGGTHDGAPADFDPFEALEAPDRTGVRTAGHSTGPAENASA